MNNLHPLCEELNKEFEESLKSLTNLNGEELVHLQNFKKILEKIEEKFKETKTVEKVKILEIILDK